MISCLRRSRRRRHRRACPRLGRRREQVERRAGAGAPARRRRGAAAQRRRPRAPTRSRRLSRTLRPARRSTRGARRGRSSSTRSSRSWTRSSRTAVGSGRARSPHARSRQSTAARFAPPTSSSPTRTAHAHFFAELAGLEEVEVCFVGAEDRLFRPGWEPPEPFRALFVGKLIPLQGVETILAAGAARARDPLSASSAAGSSSRCSASSPPNVEHVPWIEYELLPGEIQPRGLRARHLRHRRQGAAGHPEQGVPGPRMRDAARHRRHACRARAARRRAERAPRPGRRRKGPRRRGAPARGRRGARAPDRRRRPRGLRARGERSRSRAALAAIIERLSETLGLRAESPRARSPSGSAAYAAGFAALSVLRHEHSSPAASTSGTWCRRSGRPHTAIRCR